MAEDKQKRHPVNWVRWIHRDKLDANAYNPNHVAPLEMELLKTSILEDGWTQPVVIREDMTIVDGFHRWLTSGDPEVYELTDGYVPCVVLKPANNTHHAMMSTIRHNRARGTHHVLKMADIVIALIQDGQLQIEDVMEGLGMEKEEVTRLFERGNMLKRASADEFTPGWVPQPKGK